MNDVIAWLYGAAFGDTFYDDLVMGV